MSSLQAQAISKKTLEQLLLEIDKDEIPIVDEEADFDYQRDVRQRKKKEEQLLQSAGKSIEEVKLDEEDELLLGAQPQVDIMLPTENDSRNAQAETIFKHRPWNNITRDLKNPTVQTYVGKPVLLRTSRLLIAVGTDKGLILLYNAQDEKRLAIIGTVTTSKLSEMPKHQAITSIDFGPEDSRLLVSATNSELVVWSLDTYLPVKRWNPFPENSFANLLKCAFVTLSSPANFPIGAAYLNSAFDWYIAAINTAGTIRIYSVRKTIFALTIEPFYLNELKDFPRSAIVESLERAREEKQREELEAKMLADEMFPVAPPVATMMTSRQEATQTMIDDAIVDFKVLPIGEGHSPCNLFGLAAVCTRRTITIVELAPAPRRIAIIENPTSQSVIPLVAFHRSEVPNDEYVSGTIGKAKTPSFAVLWGKHLQMFRVVSDETGTFLDVPEIFSKNIYLHKEENTTFMPVALGFLSEHILVVMSQKEIAVFDPFFPDEQVDNQKELPNVESIPTNDSFSRFSMDLLNYQAVNHMPKFSEATNVSHPSASIFVLSDNYVQSYSVKTWIERIKLWNDIGQLETALKYAVELHNGFCKAAIGVPTNVSTRHRLVSQQISMLLTQYYEKRLKIETGNEGNKRYIYEQIGRTCISYALQINNLQVIWDLFVKYRQDKLDDLFFQILQPFILGEIELKSSLGPYHATASNLYFGIDINGKDRELVSELFDYYRKMGKYEELENCLLRLELFRERYTNEDGESYRRQMDKLFNDICATCLDRISKQASQPVMYKLFAYSHNNLHNEYLKPLEDGFFLFAKTRQDVSKPQTTDAVTKLMFDYMHKIYSGQTFSMFYSIPDSRVASVKQQLIDFIFPEQISSSSTPVEYSNLDILLRSDYPSFFRFMRLAFSDTRSTSPWIGLKPKISRQKIAEILISHIIDTKTGPLEPLSENMKWPLALTAELLSFLIEFVARTEKESETLEKGDNGIIKLVGLVKQSLEKNELDFVMRALNFLCADTEVDNQTKKEREHYLKLVLSRYEKLPESTKLINYCEDRKYYQVAIHLYRQKHGKYSEIISCYLKDELNNKDVFKYIETEYDRVNDEERKALCESFIQNVVKLIQVDPSDFTQLVFSKFPDAHSEVMKGLVKETSEADRFFLFKYLEQVNATNEKIEEEEIHQTENAETGKAKISLDEELQNTFVEMLIKFAPQDVHQFLKRHQPAKVDSLLQRCEEIAKEYTKRLELKKEEISNNPELKQKFYEEKVKKITLQKQITAKLQSKKQQQGTSVLSQREDKISDKLEEQEIIEKIEDAISFLFERKGEVRKALDNVMKKLQNKMNYVLELFKTYSLTVDPDKTAFIAFREYALKYNASCSRVSIDKAQFLPPAITVYNAKSIEKKELIEHDLVRELKETLDKALKLCRRTTKRKTSDNPNEIWFTLLDSFLMPLRKMRIVSMDVKNRELNQEILAQKTKLERDLARAQRNADDTKSILDSIIAEKRENAQKDPTYNSKSNLYKNDLRKVENIKAQIEKLVKEQNKEDPYAADNLPPLANLWLQDLYLKCSSRIINDMINRIPVPIIIRKVIDSNKDDEFAYIRNVIFRLLNLYDFEHDLMRNTNNILERDTFRLCKEFKEVLSRGIKPVSTSCCMCEADLSVKIHEQSTFVRLFECGHAFHFACVAAISNCPLCPHKRGVRAKPKINRVNEDAGDDDDPTAAKKMSNLSTRLQILYETGLKEESKMSVYKNLLSEVAKLKKKNVVHSVHVQSKLPITVRPAAHVQNVVPSRSDVDRIFHSSQPVYFDMASLLQNHENMFN